MRNTCNKYLNDIVIKYSVFFLYIKFLLTTLPNEPQQVMLAKIERILWYKS